MESGKARDFAKFGVAIYDKQFEAAEMAPGGRKEDTVYFCLSHPGVELRAKRANLKSISHRYYLFEVAFVWESTNETIHLPLGCLDKQFEAAEAAPGGRTADTVYF